ncbi:lytic transglycosylase domain-containing protein [Novosphingobium sp. SG720]|uniref:lytic transglycosylase domain-containing protein n=1 Tax=Novosphingobium sp. SG720 TaxID=2586998 RepID=UPI001447722D|nr:lytic transglycosylase domain-containing protein [Novosphingobium sp. SG720]NKJ44859.1 soluble lytic murein transglycosylase-like protein [Novosphingobium sp. SG720]
MGPLKPLAFAAACLVATSSIARPPDVDPVSRWRAEILEASARFSVPVAWIERVMRAESGGQTMRDGRPIISRAGAMGLMQVMPATWATLRAAHGLGANPHDPRDNILAGTAYLRAMYDRFGYPGLFAAYNAGPGRYAAHLATGRALPAETQAYVAQVSGTHSSPAPSLPQRSPPALFVVLRISHTAPGPSPSRASDTPADTLFAVRAPR